jgi:HlyD family secretion protein
MDRPRVGRAKARWLRIILFGGLTLVAVGVVTFLLAHLGAAAPVVARNSVWIDTVKRGSFLRQVRGLGTLVPEDISWIASRNDARIEKILIWPGTKVEPGTTILVITTRSYNNQSSMPMLP